MDRPTPTLRKSVLPVALAVLLGVVPAGASAEDSSAHEAPVRIHFAGGGQVRGDLGPLGDDPIASASSALARVAGRLGVDAFRFELDSVRRSNVGIHVRGREVRGGVPVDRTSAAVHALDGRVVQVDAHASPLPGRPVAAPIPRRAAVAAALAATGVTDPFRPPVAERLLVRDGRRLADAWRVHVFSLAPAVAAEVDVSAADGRVLAVRDPRRFLEGQATVFDPNPIVTLKDASLRQPGVDMILDTDLDDPRLNEALRLLPAREVSSTPADLVAGRLSGPYVDVFGPPGLSTSGAFLYTRGDPRFETAMAYVHLDRLQRDFQALGFTGEAAINAEPQTVITHRVEGFDNSFFMPATDLILFGHGGVDDAEDAEVILHEMGHAIHHDQVPNWGRTRQGGAMGEGFGDFLAAAYYAGSISDGFQDPCVADWDATSYSSAEPPCLRRTDTSKVYPKDMRNQVHADGEIWSGFLWDLRGLLACPAEPPEDDPNWETDPECREPRSDSQIMSDRVLKLLLTSHFFLTPEAEFGDGVAALRTAADALGRPEWADLVDQAASARGLPLDPE